MDISLPSITALFYDNQSLRQGGPSKDQLLGLRRNTAHIHRSASTCTVIALAAPDARRITVFIPCTNRQRIPREGQRMAEMVIIVGVGGLQVGLREPIAGNTQRIDAGIGGYRKGEGHILCFT